MRPRQPTSSISPTIERAIDRVKALLVSDNGASSDRAYSLLLAILYEKAGDHLEALKQHNQTGALHRGR
eukprot:13535-Eustigmatos_ZCMA.PRE.1